MTSMNAVLMKFFNLPPAVRMVLAVAGFGSLASIFYFLGGGFLRSRKAQLYIVVILGIGIVVFGLIYLLRRMMTGKRSTALAGALDSQGPTRGDVAEQEQIYRDKFRNKLGELRTNGLSVYKLPWFVVIGEPGCGKTASLIQSGLDFPLGKDEVPGFGGTRNYNWWFTNDAVILDTAGRIAFHEEGSTDKVEWEYFLKLLRNHRPRCPINGVVVALPADKLLRDTSEERAQKATVLRERLRQVHQTLGVRFPTFVLVTKMDLVGGFNEFFEEIRPDLLARKQMFGWSRPGEFQEPFDPSVFPQAFDQVYYRLRDWAMRYLQRKATEQELGLLVTFPEAFRQLRQPLEDYIGTAFQKSPLLEPPFFRGFYFTSAVQEGAPIFDVFTRRRPGVTTHEHAPKAVQSLSFFLHDFYAKKVFAEHGLVFRSAQHVTLNKRMRRVVGIGSGALLALMLSLFAFGYLGVHDLVTSPQKDCQNAVDVVHAVKEKPATYAELRDRLALSQQLQKHYVRYDSGWAGIQAHALYVLANIGAVRENVRLIHGRYVLDAILRPIVREAETRLAARQQLTDAPEEYRKALKVYARWYGETASGAARPRLTTDEATRRASEFRTLLEFLGTSKDPNDPAVNKDTREALVTQVTEALRSLAARPRTFGTEVLRDGAQWNDGQATKLLKTAIGHLTQLHVPQTELAEKAEETKEEFLKYWLDLGTRVQNLRALYQEMLGLDFARADQYAESVKRLTALTEDVDSLLNAPQAPKAGSLARAYYDLRTFLDDPKLRVPQTDAKRMVRFNDQLKRAEKLWQGDFTVLGDALKAGGALESDAPQKDVYEALAEATKQLGQRYTLSLNKIREKIGTKENEEPLDTLVKTDKLLKKAEAEEGMASEKDRASLSLADHPLGTKEELSKYLSELREVVVRGGADTGLNDLRTWPKLLQQGEAVTPTGPTLKAWFDAVGKGTQGATPNAIRENTGLTEVPFWQPVELYSFSQAVWKGYQQNTVGALLQRMQAKCEEVKNKALLPGLAQLLPDCDKAVETLPFQHARPAAEAAKAKETPEKPPEEEADWRKARREPTATAPGTPATERPGRSEALPPLVAYHTRAFLYQTLKAYFDVLAVLERRSDKGGGLRAALDQAADTYIGRYFLDWNGVYDNYQELLDEATLKFLQECAAGKYEWPTFEQALEKNGQEMASEFSRRLEAVVREVVLFQEDFRGDSARYDALLARVDSQLDKLGAPQNLQKRLDDFGRAASKMLQRREDPVAKFSEDLTNAWRDYLAQLKKLGADPKQADPPDRKALQQTLDKLVVWRSLKPEEFRLTATLLEVSEYGEVLLRHHLDKGIATLVQPYQGHYPLVGSAADSDPSFKRLGELANDALPPDKLLELLRKADQFQRSYDKVINALRAGQDNQYVKVPKKCNEWVTFLYGPDVSLLQTDKPKLLRVKYGVSKGEKTVSAGDAYSQFSITLPLLSETGQPLPEIICDARSATAEKPCIAASATLALRQSVEQRWSLFLPPGAQYAKPAVRVSDKNVTVPHYPQKLETNWSVPGSPWAILLLMGADTTYKVEDIWTIPVLLQAPDATIGFDIAIRFERPFPGLITPVADPGTPPPMTEAAKYFAGVAPRGTPE